MSNGKQRAGRGIRLRAAVVLSSVMGFAAPPIASAQSAHADSAITAAEASMHRWFVALANGDYAASWAQAAKYFRDHVTLEQWIVNARPLARQFDRIGRRRLVEARWLRDLPPMAPAEYVVLRWVTTLDNDRQVGERVIVSHETDGTWRPATYDLYPNVWGEPILLGKRRADTTLPPPSPPRRTWVAPRPPP